MFTILKNTENGLVTLHELIAGSWVHAVDPAPDEIAYLQSGVGAPPDFITYPLDLDERARTEKDNGAILIVLRIPHFQGISADVPYATMPLGIVLTDKLIVTICRTANGVVQELLDGRVKGLSTAKRNRFVLHLLLASAQKYLSYLREINKTVDALEDRLQLSLRNREVLELLKYQKSLTYFMTALKQNELMMQRLQRSRLFEMYPDDEDLLDDVLTEIQQAIEMTSISSNILSQMMDAFASIISNNLNAVMKFLASVTIVLSVPTMIASFFGMNVHIPMEDQPVAFLAIILMSVATSLFIAYIFVKRDWF